MLGDGARWRERAVAGGASPLPLSVAEVNLTSSEQRGQEGEITFRWVNAVLRRGAGRPLGWAPGRLRKGVLRFAGFERRGPQAESGGSGAEISVIRGAWSPPLIRAGFARECGVR
ncbi:hypothetical protein GCM10027174_34490 [Salinifilum aidingensis]